MIYGMDSRTISLRGVKDIKLGTLVVTEYDESYLCGLVQQRDLNKNEFHEVPVVMSLDSEYMRVYRVKDDDKFDYKPYAKNDFSQFYDGLEEWDTGSGVKYYAPERSHWFCDLVQALTTHQVEGGEILKGLNLLGIDVKDLKLIRNFLGGWIIKSGEYTRPVAWLLAYCAEQDRSDDV